MERQRWLIRPGARSDLPVLERMIYEALYWQPDAERESFAFVIAHPEISRYVDGWGRSGDSAVIAELTDGAGSIGAAWYRRFSEDAPGYGYVSSEVPEIAIAVERDYRGLGVGRALMEALIAQAALEGVAGLSLSVEVANIRALRLYERLGFLPMGGDEHNYTMLLRLNGDH